jgi:hypothetical protein
VNQRIFLGNQEHEPMNQVISRAHVNIMKAEQKYFAVILLKKLVHVGSLVQVDE